jgi:hypothetical protein
MVIVFSGPTLAPDAAKRLFPEARCQPPAAQGDVYHACRVQPAVICLIDGYFEHQPAVTHKELLWALHQGVVVYGASSMGALRAAELSSFGMRGWGKVYELFAAGELEDDDEVTVVHAESERGFLPASEALVNIRLTLGAAVDDGILPRKSAFTLVAHAKALFYPERQYPRILSAAAEAGLSRSEIVRFERWLGEPGKRVDQKAADASTLLAHVRAGYRTSSLPPKVHAFDFPYTDAWHELRLSFEQSDAEPPTGFEPAPSALDEDVLEEIQLLGPETFQRVLSAATWRALCLDLDAAVESTPANGRSPAGDGSGAQPALDRVPERPSPKWLSEHDLDAEGHRRLIEDECHVARVNALARRRVLSQIPNVLTLLGDYPKVRERARDKRQQVGPPGRRPEPGSEREARARAGITGKPKASPGIEPEAAQGALRYYFEGRLGRAIPDDLTAFARSTGFASRDELVTAICRDAEFMRRRK